MDDRAWDERYAASEHLWPLEPNVHVAGVLADAPAGRALDWAAGEGRHALWLAERGWQVTAVDFSSVAIDRGRQRAARAGLQVDWQVRDVTTWQPPAAAFDLVLIAYLHLPAGILRSSHRAAASAVAPGGRLLVVDHDLTNLTEGVGGPPDPDRLVTPDSVVADLEGTGLHVDRAERVHRDVDTDEGTRIAIDCLVVATRP